MDDIRRMEEETQKELDDVSVLFFFSYVTWSKRSVIYNVTRF